MAVNKFDLVTDFVSAGFSGLWVLTQEPEQAQAALYEAMKNRDEDFSFASWDCDRGLLEIGESLSAHGKDSKNPGYPLSPAVYAHSAVETRRIICLHNYHRILDSGSALPLIQAFYNALIAAETLGTHYVVFSPALRIPAELDKAFTVFEFPLPKNEEIQKIAGEILQGSGLDLPIVDPSVVDAARGLTRRELRNVLSLSLIQEQRFEPAVVWGLKAEAVEKSGILQLLKSNDETFGSIAGLSGAKDLIKRLCTFRPAVGEHAKGILLTGAPGCGKSMLCRAMGAETGRPVLRLDVGSLMSKHVGDSEANLRSALATAEAIAPCILQIEELEKAMAGASGENDSGVMRRMFGHLLTWMEERKSPIFVAASSNDTSKLPPEFLRAGRWSCEMFVDLPTPEERASIWSLYLKRYKLPDTYPIEGLDDTDWTGGEIKQCAYLAAQLDIPLVEAARKVRITARSRRALIDDLRKTAADTGMLSATTGEPYVLPGASSAPPPVRKISTGRRNNNNQSEMN